MKNRQSVLKTPKIAYHYFYLHATLKNIAASCFHIEANIRMH